MNTYMFEAQLAEEEDGRWSAWLPALPGCAVWGYSREQAMNTLEEAAELFVEEMLENGESVPRSDTYIPEERKITVSDNFPHMMNKTSNSIIMIFGNTDGRKVTICYYDSTGEETLPPTVLDNLIQVTGWTEADARRLGLI